MASKKKLEFREKPESEAGLIPGEVKVVAMVKLMLNRGRLKVKPGQVVVLGPEDTAQGVHIDNLLKSGAVVKYESEEQAEAIARRGDDAEKRREVK